MRRSEAKPSRAVVEAPARARAARAFLRAPALRCRAPFATAVSIREQSAVCAVSAAAPSPDATASWRRLNWVFTALVRRRFSSCSRSVRALRFFCEAMLAIGRRWTIAAPSGLPG